MTINDLLEVTTFPEYEIDVYSSEDEFIHTIRYSEMTNYGWDEYMNKLIECNADVISLEIISDEIFLLMVRIPTDYWWSLAWSYLGIPKRILNWMQFNDPNGEWENILTELSVDEAKSIIKTTLERWKEESEEIVKACQNFLDALSE